MNQKLCLFEITGEKSQKQINIVSNNFETNYNYKEKQQKKKKTNNKNKRGNNTQHFIIIAIVLFQCSITPHTHKHTHTPKDRAHLQKRYVVIRFKYNGTTKRAIFISSRVYVSSMVCTWHSLHLL